MHRAATTKSGWGANRQFKSWPRAYSCRRTGGALYSLAAHTPVDRGWRVLGACLQQAPRAATVAATLTACALPLHRWAAAAAEVCLERGTIRREELDARLGPELLTEQAPK